MQVEAQEDTAPLLGKEHTDELSPSDATASSSSYIDFHALTTSSTQRTTDLDQSKNALGTISGVYVPCLLNIIGVILFLRLGFGVGQAGASGMLFVFCMAETQAVLTVISSSAIASNGNMKGGGSYYLISRSLGPECGGAIGVLFYFLHAVGIAMCLVGFAEEIQQTWIPDPAIGKKLVVVLIATGGLIMILAIALGGANAFARVNRYLFVLQFVCVAIGAFFIFVLSPHPLKSGGDFIGVSIQNIRDNWSPHYTSEQNACGPDVVCSLDKVYAIVFPLATGFMEGLNLSGDLKNPGRSIPVGTLAAVATSCVVYISLIFTFASAFSGHTLRNNFTFFQEVSSMPFIVIAGVLVSSFSSGLGALFGASRILQAIARDDLFSPLNKMKQGSSKGDEPQNAVLFTAVVAQVFICLGDLDVIAPICTSFFCLAYATVNFTCFLLQVTGVPNFRPTFRFHSWHLSLAGTILNLGVMIYLNVLYALISLLILTALFFYLYLTAETTSWGDISQALMYHQVRKYLLRLDSRKAHSKFWRPAVLLLADDIESCNVELCNRLKKGGLYVIGNVVVGDFDGQSSRVCASKHHEWLDHIFSSKLKAIPQVLVASNVREGYRMVMQASGLGGMQINTVVVPWLDVSTSTDKPGVLGLTNAQEYLELLMDATVLKKNAVVIRHADHLDKRLFKSKKRFQQPLLPVSMNSTPPMTIDVWIKPDLQQEDTPANVALLLQLAYVLYSNRVWHQLTRIRLIKGCESTDSEVLQEEREKLEQVIERLRMAKHVDELVITSCSGTDLTDMAACAAMNQSLQQYSKDAAQILFLMPSPRDASTTPAAAQAFLEQLDTLTADLPSIMLVLHGDDDQLVVSTSI